jgi:regulator of cell morphogenesis and NO signaling
MSVSTESHRTLAELVAENPARAVVLDRLGLDFCCHGNRSLFEACAASGLDPEMVTAALETVVGEVPASWIGGGRGELAAYVESVHHSYLHAELDSLESLSAKVRSVHGSRHPELEEVTPLIAEIAADFRPHLAVEEDEVFPAIASLAPGSAGDDRLAARIDELVAEHTALGSKLARLRELTSAYTVPEDGCASYRSLYERLAHLESDTHIHIHLENNVLFPAALVEAV